MVWDAVVGASGRRLVMNCGSVLRQVMIVWEACLFVEALGVERGHCWQYVWSWETPPSLQFPNGLM